MQQIIYFITKNSTKLLFLLLLVVSLYLTVQTHSYHQSQMLHSANVVSGTIYEKTNSITEYLHLKDETFENMFCEKNICDNCKFNK